MVRQVTETKGDVAKMKKGFTARLDSDVVSSIKELASESEITQREVVELCVLACVRLGLFDALSGSGVGTDKYENLVRLACDGYMSNELYEYVKATVASYRGTMWD